ncbi:carbohydrate ABC transporter permease [Paenibacillus nasutitermitis]|uniref:ABC transporter permease n=1 Tax=Paenibacillus nasutitermitis TaxID=1652958 RepID=A0A917DYJ8_9BACL|nr:carbohydrate ABC transporter permease [Paenibacillus nasutitermitis]GGD79798.1 ABC transporter permease [Paenibacillus nasutitermitis]
MKQIRKLIFGLEADRGLLFKCFIYLILIDVAYIYLNPILYMVTTMVKNRYDLLDPAVIWAPREIYLGVIQQAFDKMNYLKGFMLSTSISSVIAICQTLSCAVAGYAFARLQFPFKRLLFFCLILAFIVPPQVTILPMILGAGQLHILNTYWPLILPALFGHGLKGALFVIIYRQFFSTQPRALEEAAKMDGANVLTIFYRVMLPLARPAIVVVFLFSFVWNWNDSYYPAIFVGSNGDLPLSLGISQLSAILDEETKRSGPSVFDESMKMAASFLIILPVVILYSFTQRWFVEGVDRTGLVE